MSAQDTEQPQKSVELYDFRRPTTLAREHSRVLESAFDSFARQWATQLTAKVRVKSGVTGLSVIMQTYDEYIATLPPTTTMVLFTISGHESNDGYSVFDGHVPLLDQPDARRHIVRTRQVFLAKLNEAGRGIAPYAPGTAVSSCVFPVPSQ